jgi:hypothetical protein
VTQSNFDAAIRTYCSADTEDKKKTALVTLAPTSTNIQKTARQHAQLQKSK